MNNHTKLAYQAGVQQALADAGLTKTSGFIDDLIGAGRGVARREVDELERLLGRRVRTLSDQHEAARYLPDRMAVFDRGPLLTPHQARELTPNPDWKPDEDLAHLVRAYGKRREGETLRGAHLRGTFDRIPEEALSAPRFSAVNETADELVALERKLMEQEARTRGARGLAAGAGALGLGAVGLHGALDG